MNRLLGIFAIIFICSVPNWAQQQLRYKIKRSQTAYIPEEVQETSGLVYLNGELITHNDSGNKNVLYVLDTIGGVIKKQIPVSGAINRDWEAISLLGNKLYIGDFGNNNGSRNDLTIYILDLELLPQNLPTLDSIRFSYPEQTDFSKRKRNHNFDCEAMVVFNDSVILYSKSWQNGISDIRVLPAKPGKYEAPVSESFDAGGLITDASFSAERNMLVLTGYTLQSVVLQPFVWIFYTNNPAKLKGKERIKINLSPDFTQLEAVTFLPSGRLALSAEAVDEKFLDIAQALFLIWPDELLGINKKK